MPIYEYQCKACSHELEVIQKIKVTPTGPGDVPQSPIVINSATLVK